MNIAIAVLLAPAAFMLAACSDGLVVPDDPVDLAAGWSSQHRPEPLLTNLGSASIDALQAYTIVWRGDETVGAKTERYVDWLLRSDAYLGPLAQYGVRAGASMGLIVLPGPTPKTLDYGDAQLNEIVDSLIASAQIAAPSRSSFLIFVPPSETKSHGSGRATNESFAATTAPLAHGGVALAYAVARHEPTSTQSGFEALTHFVSAMAAVIQTDPAPDYRGWQLALDERLSLTATSLCWPLAQRAEVSGLADNGTYLVARVYSNDAAQAGDRDPCQPSAAAPYYNVVVDPFVATLRPTSMQGLLEGTDSSYRGEATVQLFAYGDVGLISWRIADAEALTAAGYHFMPASGQGHAGEKVRLEVRSDTIPLAQSFRIEAEGEKSGRASSTAAFIPGY